MTRFGWLAAIGRDLSHAGRMVRRDARFVGLTTAILGLAIGMATAVSTAFEAVLLRDLPVHEQDRVVVLWGVGSGSLPSFPVDYPQYTRFRERSRTLTAVEGVDYNGAWPRAFRDGERVLSLRTSPVTGGWFEALGVRPVLGRLLRPEDDVAGAENVAVLSHAAWTRLYGGSSDVLGRRIVLHGLDLTYTVVGVAPSGLEYPAGVDVWIPVVPFGTFGRDSVYALLHIVGRLGPGVSAEAARDEMHGFLRDEAAATGAARVDAPAAAIQSLATVMTGDVRPALTALTAAVALLLIIACINIGNLLIVRAVRRSPEIALRRVLGAGSLHIFRQLLAESAVIAVLGGSAGLILAQLLLRSVVTIAPPELPLLERVRMEGQPLAIAAAVTLGCTLLFGLAPALWAARTHLGASLRSGRSAGSAAMHRARRVLVVGQVALAVIVLAAAGLVGRSLARLQQLDMGFDARGLAVLELDWPWSVYSSPERVRALYDLLLPRVRSVAGVQHVTPVLLTPFSGTGGWDGHFVAEGQSTAEAAANPYLNMEVAGTEYFAAFETPILRGRSFSDEDREGSPPVVVVNGAVAARFWPGEDPIGKRIALNAAQPEEWLTVVGVAGETRYRALRRPAPTVYFPFAQTPWAATMLAVRTRSEADVLVPVIRRAITEAAPDVFVWRAESMERLIARELSQPRMSALLLAAFSAVALLLAAIGIYGVIMLTVRQRTPELGVRLALGASPARLRGIVLGDALMMLAAGTLLGIAGALMGGRILESLLFGVEPTDPLTLGAVILLLLAVGLAAAYGPAQRVTHIDPAQALRSD